MLSGRIQAVLLRVTRTVIFTHPVFVWGFFMCKLERLSPKVTPPLHYKSAPEVTQQARLIQSWIKKGLDYLCMRCWQKGLGFRV